MSKLTVRNAEIKTATVEVRTLTLSGKQVTLSVFKQIEQEDLINGDGSLAGEPWGRVNYHPDKCADGKVHSHVVWQHGSELRRDAIPKDLTYHKHFFVEPPSGRPFVAAVVLASLSGGQGLDFDDRSIFGEGGGLRGMQHHGLIEWYDKVGTLTIKYVPDQDVIELHSAWWRGHRSYSDSLSTVFEEKKAAVSARLRAWGKANSVGVTPQELRARTHAEIDELARRARKVAETADGLHHLPQLFIAV